MSTKDEFVLSNLLAQKAKLEEKLDNAVTDKEAKSIQKEIDSIDEQLQTYQPVERKEKKAKKAKK
jgi:hypothetical protein